MIIKFQKIDNILENNNILKKIMIFKKNNYILEIIITETIILKMNK